MRLAAPLLVGLYASTACAGCSDSNVLLTAPSDPRPDARSACTTIQKAVFSEHGRCSGISLAVEEYLNTPIDPYCAFVDNDVAVGRLVFDASRTLACVAALAAQACDDSSYPAECSAVFVGQVPDGGMCIAAVECGHSYTCDESVRCPGTCGPGLPVGGDCLYAACEAGLLCVSTGKGDACAVPLAAGSACDPTADACGAGLYCNTVSVCVPYLAGGAGPCGTSSKCTIGTYCSGTSDASSQCLPQKGEGQPCSPGESECFYGLYCHGGVCSQWPGIGEVCGTSIEGGERAPCQAGYCETNTDASSGVGTCAVLLRDGAACDSSLAVFGEDPCVYPDGCGYGFCEPYLCY